MKIPFLVWLLQGIPECIAFSAVVCSLITGNLSWDIILKIGLLQAAIIYIVRLFPMTPGVHVILYITSLAFLVVVFCRVQLKKATITSAIIMVILIFFEMCYRYIIYIFGLTPKMMMDRLMLRIIAGYPQVIFLFIMAYLVKVKGERIRKILDKVTKTEFYY